MYPLQLQLFSSIQLLHFIHNIPSLPTNTLTTPRILQEIERDNVRKIQALEASEARFMVQMEKQVAEMEGKVWVTYIAMTHLLRTPTTQTFDPRPI